MAAKKNWRYKVYKGSKVVYESTTRREADAKAAQVGGRVKDTQPSKSRNPKRAAGSKADYSRGFATALSVLGLYDPKGPPLPRVKNPAGGGAESGAFLRGYATAMRYYGSTTAKGKPRAYKAGKTPRAAYRVSSKRTRSAPIPYVESRADEDPRDTRYVKGMRARRSWSNLKDWIEDYEGPKKAKKKRVVKKTTKKTVKKPTTPKKPAVSKARLSKTQVHGAADLKKYNATRYNRLKAWLNKQDTPANSAILLVERSKGKWELIPSFVPQAQPPATILKSIRRKFGINSVVFKVNA